MGVDLKMLVCDGYFPENGFGFAHTVLETGGDHDYHDRVQRLPSEAIPEDFYSYVSIDSDGELRYGQVKEDCYGQPVRAVLAGDLAKIKYREASPRLAAAIAYIKALPPDTRVALYWH